MQRFLVATLFLAAVASATRTSPEQGKINKPVDQAATAQLRSTYDRLVKSAAQVEKAAGDASVLKNKHSDIAARALVQDPKTITSVATELATQAYAVMGSKPPASQGKPADELHTAYHEILAAAEGVELVRRSAATLAPEKVTAFAAEMQKGPEKVEKDVKSLMDDMNAAEEDVDAAEKKLKETKAKEEATDDKDDKTEAEAANKAAKQGLAEADHEQHGGDQLLGKATEDKKREEAGAAKKAEAKADVEAATAEHKAADAAHEKADAHDDKNEDKVEKAEKKLAEAKEEHVEAVEEHNDHPDAEEQVKAPHKAAEKSEKSEKGSAQQLASYVTILTLAMLC